MYCDGMLIKGADQNLTFQSPEVNGEKHTLIICAACSSSMSPWNIMIEHDIVDLSQICWADNCNKKWDECKEHNITPEWIGNFWKEHFKNKSMV